MKLSELCILKGGFQGKILEGGNTYRLIKLKDVSSYGDIKYDDLAYFTSEKEIDDKYILKKNDVIFKAKSGDNTAAIIDIDEEKVVATSHFIILTVKDTNILDPQYLVAYLNSEQAEDYFDRNSEGSVLSIIKLKTLEDIEIKLIDIEKQKEISKVYKLVKEEKEIMSKMLHNREKQFKEYFRRSLE